jgi:hypothetical protein
MKNHQDRMNGKFIVANDRRILSPGFGSASLLNNKGEQVRRSKVLSSPAPSTVPFGQLCRTQWSRRRLPDSRSESHSFRSTTRSSSSPRLARLSRPSFVVIVHANLRLLNSDDSRSTCSMYARSSCYEGRDVNWKPGRFRWRAHIVEQVGQQKQDALIQQRRPPSAEFTLPAGKWYGLRSRTVAANDLVGRRQEEGRRESKAHDRDESDVGSCSRRAGLARSSGDQKRGSMLRTVRDGATLAATGVESESDHTAKTASDVLEVELGGDWRKGGAGQLDSTAMSTKGRNVLARPLCGSSGSTLAQKCQRLLRERRKTPARTPEEDGSSRSPEQKGRQAQEDGSEDHEPVIARALTEKERGSIRGILQRRWCQFCRA